MGDKGGSASRGAQRPSLVEKIDFPCRSWSTKRVMFRQAPLLVVAAILELGKQTALQKQVLLQSYVVDNRGEKMGELR